MAKKGTQLSLFNVLEKIEQSTTSIAELRVPIFAPVQKLSGNSTTAQEFKKNGGIRIIETSWGKVEIRGRKLLTQVHRDLLDCIYTHAKEVKHLDNGEIMILFSQTKILKEYSGESKSDSWTKQTKWLKDKIKEIRDITINYVNTKDDSFDFNLISHLDYMDEYKAYSITLDKRYLKFYERELSINYKKELPKLLKVDSALIKAILRWFFTHKNKSRYKLMTVLDALGYPTNSPKSMQAARRELKNRVGELNSFGLDYDYEDEIFYYQGNTNVGFIPSLWNKSKKELQETSKELNKLTLNELLGKKIFLNDTVLSIKEVIYEMEGALINSAYVETKEGVSFHINNINEDSHDVFEEAVILYLTNLLLKEKG
jgi:hypothetical protein